MQCKSETPFSGGKAVAVDFDLVSRADIDKAANCLTYVLDTYDLVGVSAPQIGLPWQMIAVRVTEEQIDEVPIEVVAKLDMKPVPLTLVVNPAIKVISTKKDMVEGSEGCGSMVGFSCPVLRHKEVEVTGYNMDGSDFTPWRVKDFTARIFQHEFDHLQGTMHVDRMTSSRSLQFDYWPVVNGKKGDFKLSYNHSPVQNIKMNRRSPFWHLKNLFKWK